jgi:hypothetical protein
MVTDFFPAEKKISNLFNYEFLQQTRKRLELGQTDTNAINLIRAFKLGRLYFLPIFLHLVTRGLPLD